MYCAVGLWDSRPPSLCAGMFSALAPRGSSACSMSHWLLRDLSACDMEVAKLICRAWLWDSNEEKIATLYRLLVQVRWRILGVLVSHSTQDTT